MTISMTMTSANKKSDQANTLQQENIPLNFVMRRRDLFINEVTRGKL